MMFELEKQSVLEKHLSYDLLKQIKGIGGSSATIIHDAKTGKSDPPISATDYNLIKMLIRDGDDNLLNLLIQEIDSLACCIRSQFDLIGSGQLFAANTAQTNMDVLNLSATTIIWDTIDLDNNVVGYNSTNGIFTPTQAGYYRVDAYFRDTHGNSSGSMELQVNTSGTGSDTMLDRYSGTTADRLSGWKIFYCNGATDTFYVSMNNTTSNGTMRFRDMTSGEHNCHMTVQYLTTQSATI